MNGARQDSEHRGSRGQAAPQAGADSVTGTSAPGAQLHAVEACGVRAGIVPPAGT
ncbi:hypothetical protein OHN37_41830 [Streptomyces sp. NBC_00485]|uniref:hypothetical protein n=1 Tax=unclassified Streptomyces TaxID=2593676 RepID=UPI002E18120B|nr:MULTISPECIES: hypothetical protein [unclassified Streptomyces]